MIKNHFKDIVWPQNLEAMKGLVRSLQRVGLTREAIREEIGLTEKQMDNICQAKMPVKRKDCSFLQGICPGIGCAATVLTGPANFRIEDDPEVSKGLMRHGSTFCVKCGLGLLWHVGYDEKVVMQPYMNGMLEEWIEGMVELDVVVARTGVQLTTSIWSITRGDTGGGGGGETVVSVVARAGVAMMGLANFKGSWGANPFDPNFHDNYVEGVGKCKMEAGAALAEELTKLTNTLFA